MSTESIPVGLRSLLSKHYFLAQISQGYKPCMSNMTLVDSSSWAGAFYRFWYGESRKTVIAEIEDIISQTIDSIATHKNKPAFLRLIINALASTRVGIESMKNTYRSDPAMIGRLQVQLTNIDLQLDEYRHLITGYSNKDKSDRSDDKIIDEVVQAVDTNDKEGFRSFLKGNIIVPSKEVKEQIKESNKESSKDIKEKEGMIPLPPSPFVSLPPSRNLPDLNQSKVLSNETELEKRRRRHRIKQSEDGTDKSDKAE